MEYVGFWKRLLAYLLDILPISLLVSAIAYFFFGFDQILSEYFSGARDYESRKIFLEERNKVRDTALILVLCYGVFMDCSKFQGTHGKMLLGIKVTDEDGERITCPQSFIRTFTKLVGIFPAFLGYIWIVFRKDKAAWHDIFAKTRVIRR